MHQCLPQAVRIFPMFRIRSYLPVALRADHRLRYSAPATPANPGRSRICVVIAFGHTGATIAGASTISG